MQKERSGRIIRGLCGSYDVAVEDGGETRVVTCPARGLFRHSGVTPLIGDRVTLCEDKDSVMIGAVLERKNAFIRPPVANLDFLFVIIACKKPEPILQTADLLISVAENAGAEPVVVLSKEDLEPERADAIRQVYEKCGFTVFTVRADKPESLLPLREYIDRNLPGKCAAFAGASGVGKSSLLNALFPTLQLQTGDVSRKTQRGKQTTRETVLFTVPAGEQTGFLADTPGFSLLDFEHFDFYTLADLPYNFREVAARLGHCRYTDCTHTKEEGCAVVEAVKAGEIPESRHESYVYLYHILKNKKEWD